MHRFAIAAIAAVTALSATAQQPLQCLNPDILNGVIFLGRGDQKVEVARGLPPFMSGFRAPAGLSLIGSGMREGGMMAVVAYKTSLSADKAYAAVVSALGAEGWAVEPEQYSGATFHVAGNPEDGTVCRNGERRTVMVWEVAGTSYVNIMTNSQGRGRNCNVPDPVMNMGFFGPNSPLRFQYPAGTSLAQGGGGGGGSSGDYLQSTRIISTETPASLVEYLASQIEGQGWSKDAGWSGTGNAGSTWRKTIDGQLAWSTLQIVRVSEGTYDVDFAVELSP